MKNLFKLIILSLFSATMHGQGVDDARMNQILKSLKLDRVDIKEEFCTEKKMPNAEDSYIIVIPVIQGKEEADFFTVRNYILITDKKGLIKNQYFDPAEITSDAIMLRDITIDTGLYNISANIRAFGVKVGFLGSSRPNPYSSEDLSLYYPEGRTLKKVLDQFRFETSHGEWDTQCAGEFTNEDSFIIMDKSKTNSFTDLKVKTVSVTTVSKEVGGECESKETSETTYRSLKFINGKYQ